ncbi:MAG: RNA polymerase sigma factor [Planctomycetota bacterium]
MKNNKKILELLDESGPSLYALLTKLTLNQDAAEELMQELFIKLNNSKVFQKANNSDAYAHRAAINLALDWRRCRKKLPHQKISLPYQCLSQTNNSSKYSTQSQI